MSRILKRPMFKTGGTPNEGIMHGLVNRKGYDEAGIVGRTRELAPEFKEILGEYTPKTRFPLGEIGLNLVSGKYAGDGFLSNVARSAKDPYARFTQADDARESGISGSAAKLALNQAIAEAKPDRSSVLAAEKKARYLLPPNATADQIRAKTAEIIRNEMTGSTYSPQANLERKINYYQSQYGDGSRAYNHAAFDIKIAPRLRAAGKNPRSSIKMQNDGSYKTKGKAPGVYIDVINGKVIEFDGNIAKELPEYSALLN